LVPRRKWGAPHRTTTGAATFLKTGAMKMRILRLGPALSICASALLTGCGSQSPIGSLGLTPRTLPIAARAAQRDDSGSWIASDAASQDLLYASNVHNVTVFSYPAGKLEGTLRGFYVAEGECVDQSGDVYIADYGNNRIVEYAHGAKKPLTVLKGNGSPVNCSVDPTTGDLAVSNEGPSNASIAIYRHARGEPKLYIDSNVYSYYSCSYDKSGNLFFDGFLGPSSHSFVFAELPRGASTFSIIKLDQYIGVPGGVQWRYKYVAIGDHSAPVVYEFSIRGSQGKRVGTTPLGKDAFDVSQFFIQDKTLIAPNEYFKSNYNCWDILYYNFPAGGTATKKITRGLFPRGVAVSLAQTRPASPLRSSQGLLDLRPPPLPPGCTF
jgi:hypothetical protein